MLSIWFKFIFFFLHLKASEASISEHLLDILEPHLERKFKNENPPFLLTPKMLYLLWGSRQPLCRARVLHAAILQ